MAAGAHPGQHRERDRGTAWSSRSRTARAAAAGEARSTAPISAEQVAEGQEAFARFRTDRQGQPAQDGGSRLEPDGDPGPLRARRHPAGPAQEPRRVHLRPFRERVAAGAGPGPLVRDPGTGAARARARRPLPRRGQAQRAPGRAQPAGQARRRGLEGDAEPRGGGRLAARRPRRGAAAVRRRRLRASPALRRAADLSRAAPAAASRAGLPAHRAGRHVRRDLDPAAVPGAARASGRARHPEEARGDVPRSAAGGELPPAGSGAGNENKEERKSIGQVSRREVVARSVCHLRTRQRRVPRVPPIAR